MASKITAPRNDTSNDGKLISPELMEGAPINIMYADRDLRIQYMNAASRNTLRTLESYLPVKVDAMIGQNIDVFHKNPAHQRRLLADPKNLPHNAHIKVGPETLELQAGSRVKGDVYYKSIEIHQGAVVEGRLVHHAAEIKGVELKLASDRG